MCLGTHDAQISYLLLTSSQDGILSKVGMGGFIGLVGAYTLIPPTTCPCGTNTCLHVVSVADTRPFDPRVGDDKHISLQWACNRHPSMVGLPNATGQTGKTTPGDLLHLRQGIFLDHSGIEGASSSIIFESSGLRKQDSRPFFGFWFLHCGYYYSMVLWPCAVSSTWTWVNQLLTLVQ